MVDVTGTRKGTPTFISTAVVADRDTTREALLALIGGDPGLAVAGSAVSYDDGIALLDIPSLHVLLVNLPLTHPAVNPPGLAFIKLAKKRRPDVGILSLKRDVDEPRLREALDAGADACCMATTSQGRLVLAVKAVASGATWLDPEISRILFHARPPRPTSDRAAPRLSPREREILRLLIDGYTNEEIADRLNCAAGTVKTHLTHLFRKLGVRDRVSAAVSALRLNIL